jgi:MOSC domain-containing protein YiiM
LGGAHRIDRSFGTTLMIERIYTRSRSAGPQTSHDQVEVVEGAGIKGDRYFGHDGNPGQNITFVEAEAIEFFQDEHRLPRDLSVTGRNVVTRGVRLNELVGRQFLFGSIRFRGIELCEPCMTLGNALASAVLPPRAVVKCLSHRAGLRADILSTGSLAVGDRFENAA